MEKLKMRLIICVLLPFLFFSCTQKTVKTEEKDLIKRFYLASDTSKGALNLDIEVEIPIAYKDTAVLKSIRATLISNLFGDDYISQPNDSLVHYFCNELFTEYKANNEPLLNSKDKNNNYSFNNEHTLSGFSLLSDKKIYVYGIERYVDMGGAHGLETRNYFNFDLKTGNLISENDLFIPNYKAGLADLIKKRIIEEARENNDSIDTEPVLSLEDTDYWIDSIKPNGNFYISDEGINYVFNPYEIAPYYMGQTEVSLPFDILKGFLKPNNIIVYLVEKATKQKP
jgi:hypothetical protein